MAEQPFVGREREVSLLTERLADTARGHRMIALVRGEAGIGKTTLLKEVSGAARTSQISVFRASCGELDRDRPFAVLADALDLDRGSPDPMRAALGEMLSAPSQIPGTGFTPVSELRFRITELILELLESVSAEEPALLMLEDLHWADQSTLATLQQLVASQTAARVSLLATLRPVPRFPELTAMIGDAGEAGALEIELSPLGEKDSSSIVEALVGAAPGPSLRNQSMRAGGNPLFIGEMVASLIADGAIEVADGVAEVKTTTLAPPLRLTVLRRLAFLPEDTIQTLQMASILGSTFSIAQLSMVAEKSIPTVTSLIEPGITAQVLVDRDEKLAFRHDLVRDAIYDDIPTSVRAGLHLHVGRALAVAGAHPGQIATHLALGAEPGDRESIRWIRRAATEAAPRAPAIAVELLEKARGLALDVDTQTAIDVQMIRPLLWSGRLDETVRRASRVLATSPDPSLLEGIWYAVGRALVYQGRGNESIAHLERALRDARLSDWERTRLLADLALRRNLQVDLEGAEAAAREALALAGETEVMVQSTCLSALSTVEAQRGRFDRALELATRAVRLEPPGEESVEFIQPHFFLGFALLDADRLEEARREFRSVLDLAESLRQPWAFPLVHAALALANYAAGDWDDALADARTSKILAAELGVENWLILSHSVIASISALRGDPEGAGEATRAGCRIIQELGPAQLELYDFLDSIVTVRRAEGGLHQAAEALEGAWSFFGILGSFAARRRLTLGRILLAHELGRTELLDSVAAELQELASLSTVPSVVGLSSLFNGLLHEDSDLLTRAVSAFRSSGRRFELALASEIAGEIVARSDRESGRVLLEEAAATMEGLGAVQDAARCNSKLREIGVRRGRFGSRQRPQFGWDALTKTEEQVASLAGQGLTNPQIGERLFISRRTVGTHLSHVFQKLEIASRVELAAFVAERRKSPTEPSTSGR